MAVLLVIFLASFPTWFLSFVQICSFLSLSLFHSFFLSLSWFHPFMNVLLGDANEIPTVRDISFSFVLFYWHENNKWNFSSRLWTSSKWFHRHLLLPKFIFLQRHKMMASYFRRLNEKRIKILHWLISFPWSRKKYKITLFLSLLPAFSVFFLFNNHIYKLLRRFS